MVDMLTHLVLNGSLANHATEIAASLLTGVLVSNRKWVEGKVQAFLGNDTVSASIKLGNSVRQALEDGTIDQGEVRDFLVSGQALLNTID